MNNKSKLGIALVAIALAVGVWFGVSELRRAPPPAMSMPDYTDYASWAVFPDTKPDAVWKEGWAADVLLLIPGSEIRNTRRSDDEDVAAARKRATKNARGVLPYLAGVGTVYAPLYRADNLAIDFEAAFATYLNADNQGRAFVIATHRPIPARAMSQIENDPALKDRFGGFLLLTPTNGGDDSLSAITSEGSTTPATLASAFCPPQALSQTSETALPCQSDVAYRREDGTFVFADGALKRAAILDGWMKHLRANVAPLAEPLGGFEEVEIIDVRRPGDVDPEAQESGREGE